MAEDFTPYALVADDDALIRMDAAAILEDAGFRVYEAAGVDEAMEILEGFAENIQLLFTDVQMPPGKRTGYELARLCAESWPHIGIIVASAMSTPNLNEMPDGAVFIGKPFSADVVREHL